MFSVKTVSYNHKYYVQCIIIIFWSILNGGHIIGAFCVRIEQCLCVAFKENPQDTSKYTHIKIEKKNND